MHSEEANLVLTNQPANGPATIALLAPRLRRLGDRLSGRAAIALLGGASLILWTGIMSLVLHFWR